MIRYTTYTQTIYALLLLFILSACTSSEAELAQKSQPLSKEEKIAAFRAEIQTAIAALDESFENGDYLPTPSSERFSETKSYSVSRDPFVENYDDFVRKFVWTDSGDICFWSTIPNELVIFKDTALNVSNILLTSRYATNLPSDELLTIFKTETGLPLDHVIKPQTDSNHIIVAFRICSVGSHDYPWSQFYLLDHDGQRNFSGGKLTESWTFPDGEVLFIRSQRPAGTNQVRLYRIYNDSTRWQSSELIFDPEQYGQASVTFDENGERFTAYIPSHGGWQPPCKYTAEFTEEYTLVSDWNVILSYTFDDGLFTLEKREYGDWTAIDHDPNALSLPPDKIDTLTGSELQRFCVNGTLRPVLP